MRRALGPLKSAKKSAIVGVGLALEGSAISIGSSCCGCLGANATSTVLVADVCGGWPGTRRHSANTWKRTRSAQAASGTSKLNESASRSRLGAGVAALPGHGLPQSRVDPVVRLSASTVTFTSATRFGPLP